MDTDSHVYLPPPSYLYIRDQKGLREAVDALKGHTVLAVDTETSGLSPHHDALFLVQIAAGDLAYVFDVRSLVDLSPLKEVLEDSMVTKVLQNAKFDYKMLKQLAGITLNNMFCTMLAERVLTTGITPRPSTSLVALVKKYLGVTLLKEVRASFHDKGAYRGEFGDAELEYAANDALVLVPIAESQMQELMDVGLLPTATLEFSTLPVVGDMELTGCRIDQKMWEETIDKIAHDREQASVQVLKQMANVVPQNSLFGLPVVNIGSHSQVLTTLLKMGVRESSGEPIKDTSEDTLSRVAKKHSVCETLLQYRALDKLVSAYGTSFLNKVDKGTGRLHANFNQLRADTGRSSSSGPNLQQIPSFTYPKNFDEYVLAEGYKARYEFTDDEGKLKTVTVADLRKCFIPTEGYKYVGADYSQQELRVLADASDDPIFMKAYLNNEDIHTNTAAMIYDVAVSAVTKSQRRVAKTLNFALIYGAGAWKIAQTLGIEEDEAEKLIAKYFRIYSNVKAFMAAKAAFAIKNGYSLTVNGRRRYYKMPNPTEATYKQDVGKIKRQAANGYIQGSSADVTKLALVYTHDFIREKKLDSKIIMVVHDEIITETRADQADEMARGLEDCMVRGFSYFFKKVPMLVDASISDFWTKD